MARRPLERDGVSLDGGRRTTQLMRDSLGAMRPPDLAIVAFTLMCLSGCHHGPQTAIFSGCTPATPPIGPAGYLELFRSSNGDTSLTPALGRLVLFVRWSSDSLDQASGPLNGAIAQLTGISSHTDSTALLTRDSGGPPTVSLRHGTYRVVVRHIGAVRLDTTILIREGYADTLRAYLQANGFSICS